MLLKEVGKENLESRRPPGRPRRRWWDRMKDDIEKLGALMEEVADQER